MLSNIIEINNFIMQDILIFLVPFLLSLIFTPLVRRIAVVNNLVALPKADRWHKKTTALLGGVAIYLAVIFSFFYFGFFKEFIVWFIAATGIFLVGVYDDFKKISPYSKLIFQILFGCIVVFSGYTFHFEKFPFLDIPLSIFWIVAITNSFNLLDNIDGLACGIAGISSFMLFISSSLPSIGNAEYIFLILTGASLGFLPYNFNPARIFMGDSGSMFLGFSLATFSIIGSSAQVSNLFTTLLIPVLILGVPIFDTIFVTLVRKIKGVEVFKGGVDHTSHRLVSLGLTEKKAVLILYLLSIIFGIIAISYSRFDFIIVSVFVILVVVVLLFFGMFLSEVKTYKENSTEQNKKAKFNNGGLVLNSFIMHKRRIVEVAVDFILICVAYYSAFLLRFEGIISNANLALINQSLPWIIIIKFICFSYLGLYRGVWKYVGLSDIISVFKAVSLGSVLSIIALTILFRFKDYSRVVFIIDWILTLFFISGVRIMLRTLQEYFINVSSAGKKILIFGAGDSGEMVLREIRNNKKLGYQVVGFIDDDQKKTGKKIHGISVLGTRLELDSIVKKYCVEEVIIAIATAQEFDFRDVIQFCNKSGVSCKKLSKIMEFIEWKEQ